MMGVKIIRQRGFGFSLFSVVLSAFVAKIYPQYTKEYVASISFPNFLTIINVFSN